MDNKTSGTIVGWAGVVLAILAILAVAALFATTHGSSVGAPQPGAPVFNAGANFPAGFNLNPSQVGLTTNMGQITIAKGSNQGAWKNTSSQTVYVSYGPVIQAGVASSTISVNVGTSTTATATDQFNLTTAPMWSQFISAGAIATGTPAGVLLDNLNNHKSSFPGTIAVPAGQYLLMVASSFCKTDGACNTATSTARGWSTLTLPFLYYR